MPSRPLTNNQIAAVLAFFAGLVFIAVEWNGTRIEAEFVILLADYLPGSNPGLVLLARVLAFISPLSAAFVIAGAILLLTNRVRLGKGLVLFGTGAGIVSLILFVVLLVRRPGRILAHEGALPDLFGVVLALAARILAKAPKPPAVR